MNTAQRILGDHLQDTHAQRMALESEIRDLVVETRVPNCFDRIWVFYDGSMIEKNRDGYSEFIPCKLIQEFVQY
jgi:hypothetical protein